MHFCADEAMALIALLTTAWHFWHCRCTEVQGWFWRMFDTVFGHAKNPIRKLDLHDKGLCRRCYKAVSL